MPSRHSGDQAHKVDNFSPLRDKERGGAHVPCVAIVTGASCCVCTELEYACNRRAATAVAQTLGGVSRARRDIAKDIAARTRKPFEAFAPAVAGAGNPCAPAAVAKVAPRSALAYRYFAKRAAESRFAVVADALCALNKWIPCIVAVVH